MKTKFRIFVPEIERADLASLKGPGCEHVYAMLKSSGLNLFFMLLHRGLRIGFYSSMVLVKVYLEMLSTFKCKLLYFITDFH